MCAFALKLARVPPIFVIFFSPRPAHLRHLLLAMRSLLRAAALSASFFCASSYRRYLNTLPPAVPPCPAGSGGSDGGCRGGGGCEAYGHIDCWTRGTVWPSSGRVAAASAFGKRAGAAGWSVQACRADDDGDGVPNGEELLDACCAWPLFPGVPEDRAGRVAGHPDFSSIKSILGLQ